MNTSSLLPLRVAAILFSIAGISFAQDTAPSAEKPGADPRVAAPGPLPDNAPAATPAEPAPSATAAAPAVESETPAPPRKGGLRRIDVPATQNKKASPRSNRRNAHGGDFPVGDHFVSKGSSIHEGVSIFGSTNVEGEVHSDAVSVFGNTHVGPDAKVGGAAVGVFGRVNVEGEVKHEAVSVFGGMTINGKVGAEAVCVLGDMNLGPNAVIEGDIVIVGGRLTRDPNAIVRGNQVNVPFFGGVGNLDGLTTWVKECAMKGRPLAFRRDLCWAWGIAFSFFGLYLLFALLFGKGIERCAVTFETRPGTSILASVLTVLLSPIVIILLAITIVGALLVPFVAAGLFVAGLFGKAVMLAWIGRRITGKLGDGPLSHPFFAVLFGGLIVLMLYTVWGSFLLFKLLSWLGLGVVVYTLMLATKREKAATVAAGAPPPMHPMPPVTPVAPEVPVAPLASDPAAPPPVMSPGFGGGTANPGATDSGAVAGFAAEPPVHVSRPPRGAAPTFQSFASPPVSPLATSTLPRAGFFLRLGALALDGVLIAIVMSFISGMLPRALQFNHGPGGVLLALAIYAAVMWKHKATTIGGIVCGLKVVRIDNAPLDWATAIVRALGCFLSLAVAGLGFIWVAFDDDKQSWHDKIAGTTVVRVPKGVSLL